MQEALARRDDTLVPAVPVAIRFYCRYFFNKYDTNGDGKLEQKEWEDKIPGAQAIDLDGDWILTDQEVLYYIARYARNRTLAKEGIRASRNPEYIPLLTRKSPHTWSGKLPGSIAPDTEIRVRYRDRSMRFQERATVSAHP